METPPHPHLQVRLEEFKALRAEMLAIISDRLWGQVTFGALAGGVLAFGSKAHRSASLVFLIAVGIPFLLHTSQREHSRMRLANYIRVRLEPSLPGMGWETYVGDWRARRGRSGGWLVPMDRLRHMVGLSGLYLSVALFSWILLLSEAVVSMAVAGSVLLLAMILIYGQFYNLYSEGAAERDRMFRESESESS